MFTKIAAAALMLSASAAFALPNPASVFCEKIGGKSVSATLADGGQIGLCVLGNGNIIEEWTLFRMLNGEK